MTALFSYTKPPGLIIESLLDVVSKARNQIKYNHNLNLIYTLDSLITVLDEECRQVDDVAFIRIADQLENILRLNGIDPVLSRRESILDYTIRISSILKNITLRKM